jgi:hypothetical protein
MPLPSSTYENSVAPDEGRVTGQADESVNSPISRQPAETPI